MPLTFRVATLLTGYFRNVPDLTPTPGELTQYDLTLRARYGPILANTMRAFGLDVNNGDHREWVVTLAELASDFTPAGKLQRACQFFRTWLVSLPPMSGVSAGSSRVAPFLMAFASGDLQRQVVALHATTKKSKDTISRQSRNAPASSSRRSRKRSRGRRKPSR